MLWLKKNRLVAHQVLLAIERSFAREAQTGISVLWWLSCLSLLPCWWWQEFHRVELWAMLDQKFSKIPQMGDVASNLRCDRQITGVIIRAHVRSKSKQQSNHSFGKYVVKWIDPSMWFLKFVLAIMMIVFAVLGFVVSVNAIRAINQDFNNDQS